MAFLQQVTDLYVMEGTSFCLAPAVVSLDTPVESDQFIQIDSSAPLVAQVPGGGVTVPGNRTQADLPVNISFDDASFTGLDVDLTLSFEGDTAYVKLHILDNDDPNRPTNIVVIGGSVAEDAAAGIVVATLSTIDSTPGDTFIYQLNDTRNFVIVGNEIRVAENNQIDFEAQSTQPLQVMTTDADGHSFVKDITVNITDVEADLDLVSGALIQDLKENTSSQVDLRLWDSNGNPVGITGVSGDTKYFALANPPVGFGVGEFNFSLVFSPQDFETPLDANGDNVYDYTITAFDGAQTTSRTFHFTVIDVSPETLSGTEDGETLTGSSDVELVFGFGGNDTLNGAGGSDTLTGGSGKDWLSGGIGADSFNFDLKTETVKGANRDVIMDFRRVELDHIDLSDIDAKSKTTAVNDHFKFIGTKPFHHKSGELHYIKKAGLLLVEGDMDGNGKADFQIEVHGTGLTKLLATDFVL